MTPRSAVVVMPVVPAAVVAVVPMRAVVTGIAIVMAMPSAPVVRVVFGLLLRRRLGRLMSDGLVWLGRRNDCDRPVRRHGMGGLRAVGHRRGMHRLHGV